MNKFISLLLAVLLLLSLTVSATAASDDAARAEEPHAAERTVRTNPSSLWDKSASEKSGTTSDNPFSKYFSSQSDKTKSFQRKTVLGSASQRISGDEIIWMPVLYRGAYYWFGLDNTKGAFGSTDTFSVRFFSPELSQEDWDRNISALDQNSLKLAETDDALFFELSVTSSTSGKFAAKNSKRAAAEDTAKAEAAQPVSVYISLGACDPAKADVLNIQEDADTSADTTVVTLEGPEGSQEFLSLPLQNYALCLITPNSAAVGGAPLWLIIAVVEAVILIGLCIWVCVKRKK